MFETMAVHASIPHDLILHWGLAERFADVFRSLAGLSVAGGSVWWLRSRRRRASRRVSPPETAGGRVGQAT